MIYEEYKYVVSLPKGQIIEELKQKSKSGNLTDDDYKKLEAFVSDSVYHEADYLKGYENIKNELPLINRLVNELSKLQYTWNFKKFDVYQVNLTLYGPGGSYHPHDGSILIYTTVDGAFKNNDNPSNIIIHEVTHIGIEESIISTYHVPHTMKERIVDTFVALHFGKDLPNYRIQSMGETRTDEYLNEKSDFKELHNIVEQVLHEK